ncbi:MAG: hypothetical protein IKU44_04530 [Firmicutes bacterium]|nr:hypothetical protein [Bacillota bacterium]
MSKMRVPEAPELHTRRYYNLKGIDCSRDKTEIKAYRSPDSLNMISDMGGNPVKRVGWRTVKDLISTTGKGNSFFYTSLDLGDGTEKGILFIVGEKGVMQYDKQNDGQFTQNSFKSGTEYKDCRFCHFNGTAYMFGNGLHYVGPVDNGSTLTTVKSVKAYVPEVVISRSPDGTGGTFLESLNLLTPSRKVSFTGESTDGKYYLYPKADLSLDEYKYIDTNSLVVEIMNKNGEFVSSSYYELEGKTTITVPDEYGENKAFGVCSPIIKINDESLSSVVGQDNVRITFRPVHPTKGLYKKERIDLWKANMVKAYGYSNTDRLFVVTGDRTIRYSDVNNAGYFPEDNFLTVSHKGKIVGLHRYQGHLVAITDDNEAESTVFFISGSEYDGEEFFAVRPATSGIGAIAPMSFETLGDEPLFLTKNGIYAISSTSVESRTVIRNRSYFIDRMLCEEPNLETARAVVWNNYYILCINDHCYVLDGRNTSNERGNNTNYVYECYYWENVPAVEFGVIDGELYFLSTDGKLCKFNTDIETNDKYSDDGKAIPCRWSTPLDDDGYPHYYKTMQKKGSMVSLVPSTKSSVRILCSVDGDTPFEIANFDHEEDASDIRMQDAFFKKKLKKYKRLQLIFENDGVNEPFGLISVTKTYTVNNLAK